MKVMILGVLLLASGLAWSAPKDALCTQYMDTAMRNGVENVPLDLLANTINIEFELQFNKDQMDRLLMVLTGAFENNPNGRNTVHNQVYWGCTTNLTPDELKLIQKQYREAIGE